MPSPQRRHITWYHIPGTVQSCRSETPVIAEPYFSRHLYLCTQVGILLRMKCFFWKQSSTSLNSTGLNRASPLARAFVLMPAVGPLHSRVSPLQIQLAADGEQYFHIPNCRFPTTDRKYCFRLEVGWILGYDATTRIKSHTWIFHCEGFSTPTPTFYKGHLWFQCDGLNMHLYQFLPKTLIELPIYFLKIETYRGQRKTW